MLFARLSDFSLVGVHCRAGLRNLRGWGLSAALIGSMVTRSSLCAMESVPALISSMVDFHFCLSLVVVLDSFGGGPDTR